MPLPIYTWPRGTGPPLCPGSKAILRPASGSAGGVVEVDVVAGIVGGVEVDVEWSVDADVAGDRTVLRLVTELGDAGRGCPAEIDWQAAPSTAHAKSAAILAESSVVAVAVVVQIDVRRLKRVDECPTVRGDRVGGADVPLAAAIDGDDVELAQT